MKKYINGDFIANEIRMIRRRKLKCCYLIVEGESDFKLFKRFIKENNCEVKFVNGKENVIQAIDSLNKTKTEGVLGIVDSDFDKIIDKIKLNTHNLLTTDTHDIETMIIKSKALEDFLDEYTNKIKFDKFINEKKNNFRNILLTLGTVIGMVRYISIKEEFNLKFDGIEYNRFINYVNFSINEEDLIKEVINNTENCRVTCEEIKTKLETLESKSMDFWQISCGHDLTQLISISFNNTLRGYKDNELGSNEVERILRLAYQYRYFINTELHASIKQWEVKNRPYEIFFTYNEIESLTS